MDRSTIRVTSAGRAVFNESRADVKQPKALLALLSAVDPEDYRRARFEAMEAEHGDLVREAADNLGVDLEENEDLQKYVEEDVTESRVDEATG